MSNFPTSGLKKNYALIQNTIVVILIIFSLYLSLTAILAVPIFDVQNSSTKDSLKEELTEELENYAKDDSSLLEEYLKNINQNSLDKRNDHISQIKATFRRLDLLKYRAIARMEETDHTILNNKLKLKDKHILASWYLEKRGKSLTELDRNLAFLNLNLVTDTTTNNPQINNKINKVLANAIPKENITIPTRPTLGSDLGPVSALTGWLMKTESPTLAIIIGLIGFGLLGATGSTFIKEKKAKRVDNLLIENLPSVLIKGFTAAIIIFLGVKGTLTVLTNNSNSTEPNAYALFFLAFVASVYSDKAWAWAEEKFVSDFGATIAQETN